MIRASGIIFYRKKPGILDLNENKKFGSFSYEYLLQLKTFKGKTFYEDLGGKCDATDVDAKFTAAREAAEESNGRFLDVKTDTHETLVDLCRIYISKLMEESCISFTYKKAKYVVYLVQVPYDDTKTIDFGNEEIHPEYKIQREMQWVPHSDLISMDYKKIHPRIRHFYSEIVH